MEINSLPLLTDTFSDACSFVPEPKSTYIFAKSSEERSCLSPEWTEDSQPIHFAEITSQRLDCFEIQFEGINQKVSLRSTTQISNLCSRFSNTLVYIDITGLCHHIWAPLIKVLLSTTVRVKAVYSEPTDYKPNPDPFEGKIFDLSDKILGIGSLPGFTNFSEFPDKNIHFIPLLGFEGTRFSYLVENIQPTGQIIPIIGMPGFRLEYPFHTYYGNQSVLLSTKSWRNAIYTLAHCPFSLFYQLERIAQHNPNSLLKIAPIGTKPHALGAILFYLCDPKKVEIVYDFPIRKLNRSKGKMRVHVYSISDFRPGKS